VIRTAAVPAQRPGPETRSLGAAEAASPRATLRWAVALFGLWVLLSGKLDAVHLTMGAVCAGLVAAATRPLFALPPAIGPGVSDPLPLAVAGRFALYQLWLVGQIVVGSFQVARAVLHPRLPIAPQLRRLRVSLPHPFARLVLANSITLTPGTATLDVDGDWFVVHALTGGSACSLGTPEAEGEMTRRVRALFAPSDTGARQARQRTG
jgi:multicomponent Na+:H+ antiporter subunit E